MTGPLVSTPDLAPDPVSAPAIRYPWVRLLLLALAALLVQGYHFGVDDGEIYIPAINKVFNPRLYPFGAEFFVTHAHLSLFATVVGDSARLLALPVEWAVLLWFLATLFLLLIAAWQIASVLFRTVPSRWGAVILLASLLPVPVAGTALVLSDNYLTARSFSTPLALLSIGFYLRRRPRASVLFLVLTALFHPQMAVYSAAFLVLLWYFDRRPAQRSTSALLPLAPIGPLPGQSAFAASLKPSASAYSDVLHTRTFFFAGLWHWYEWIGVLAPLLLLAACALRPPRSMPPAIRSMARALLVLGAVSTLLFLALSSTPRLESLTRFQPMRSFHLIYLLLFLTLGGLLGESLLRPKLWRWTILFIPIAVAMFALDRSTYPASPHIEWPGRASLNPWIQAFTWARANTPSDAVFALDPTYMEIPGEDRHGFRALASRSALADLYKDSGAVTMFPQLLSDWQSQQRIQRGWRALKTADLNHLGAISPVTWVIVQPPQQIGLNCPYRNPDLAVCRLSTLN